MTGTTHWATTRTACASTAAAASLEFAAPSRHLHFFMNIKSFKHFKRKEARIYNSATFFAEKARLFKFKNRFQHMTVLYSLSRTNSDSQSTLVVG